MQNTILLVTSIFPPQSGGPATFTHRFYKWLNYQNLQTAVITYSLSDKLSQNPGVILIRIGPNRIIAFLKCINKIIKNSSKHTMILANGAFIETYIACKISKRKYVLKIPGDPVWEYSRNKSWTRLSRANFQGKESKIYEKLLRIAFNKAFQNARFFIAPSNELAAFAQNWGVDKKNLRIIFNCVNSEKFLQLNQGLKKFDLITTCRLVEGKGLFELIQCASSLGLKLIIVGDGPLLTKLQNYANELKANVTFTGNVTNDQIINLLNESTVFILNSDSEATSYAIIEAKMCGLPVLAKRNDGSTTLIRHNIDGYLYSGDAADNLLNAIKKFYKNLDLHNSLGNEGRKDALTRFNEDHNFRQILQLLQD